MLTPEIFSTRLPVVAWVEGGRNPRRARHPLAERREWLAVVGDPAAILFGQAGAIRVQREA